MQRYLLFICLFFAACEPKPDWSPYPSTYQQVQVEYESPKTYLFDQDKVLLLKEESAVFSRTYFDSLLRQNPAFAIQLVQLIDPGKAQFTLEEGRQSDLLSYEEGATELHFWFPKNTDESFFFTRDLSGQALYRSFVFYWATTRPERVFFRTREVIWEDWASDPASVLATHLIYDSFIQPLDTLIMVYGSINYEQQKE